MILPHDFFAWLASHVLRDESSLRRFKTFWGLSWFAIVKGWHATEFAILFLLIFWVFDRRSPSGFRRNFAAASTLALLFAISDEYHQTFVPGRGGNWLDVMIDGLGIALAGLLLRLRRKSRKDRVSSTPLNCPSLS